MIAVEKNSKFYIPTTCSRDWKKLLAEDKHWKDDYSAKLLADCWQQANNFPDDVRRVFMNSGISLLQDIELLIAFPEYKVSLPGGSRASQNDIFVLAKGNDQLISIMVEGKKSESFGETLADWKKDSSTGKKKRLNFLCDNLKIIDSGIDLIRYQLLHRTVSALLIAKKFNAKNALMLVHSFSNTDESFDDYKYFLSLYNINNIKPNSVVIAKNIDGIDLYFGWIKTVK
jgi:hypothetical protein